MEELYQHAPSEAAHQSYDALWRRVSPGMDPFGGEGSEERRELLELPGAQSNPCCMGSEAKEDIDVVRGFIEAEQANCQMFARLARCTRDRRTAAALARMGEDAAEHIRELLAAYYLIEGECYRESRQFLALPVESFCAALRRVYHEKACSAFNYLRAADATGDMCLQKLFRELGEGEACHARILLRLLARHLG